jgi:putative heme-binding domain-containing protein
MYGALYVVENLEQYQTDPAGYLANAGLLVQDKLLRMNTGQHEWKFEEFSAEIKSLPSGRSWEVGKELFRAASCVGCHRLNGEGNVFGPDLALLNEKKHTVESILRSVLEPSREIDEKFQSNIFVLEDGRTITGMIVHETPDEIQVVINPLAKDKPTILERQRITESRRSDVSLMPTGLLDKLSREEVIDLIAYVYARGDRKHILFEGGHVHHH